MLTNDGKLWDHTPTLRNDMIYNVTYTLAQSKQKHTVPIVADTEFEARQRFEAGGYSYDTTCALDIKEERTNG